MKRAQGNTISKETNKTKREELGLARRLVLILVLFFVGALFSQAQASDEPSAGQSPGEDEPSKTVSAEKSLETKTETAEAKSWISYTPQDGIRINPPDFTIKPSGTAVFQGVSHANNGGGCGLKSSWLIYIDMEKKLSDWGDIYLRLEPGRGQTVMTRLNLFSNVNYNAYDSRSNPLARKFWYEHHFFDEQLNITCGKMDPTRRADQNIYAHNDDAQFLAYMFNISGTIEYAPHYTFGIAANACFENADFVKFNLNYFEGDANWEQVFKRGIYSAQVNIKPASLLGIDPERWDGNYRFYGWTNTRYHNKLVEEGQPQSVNDKRINYGFGLSFDQMLTDVFGVFTRFGWQRPDLIRLVGGTSGATLEWTWSVGGQMKGKCWKREKDVLGIAVGQDVPSRQYKDAGHPGSTEGSAEVYYNFALNEHLYISPDFQLVWNPFGVKPSDNVYVYGVRTYVKF